MLLVAMQQAMEAALQAVEIAYELTGSSAVYDSHPIGRCFRDIRAARQHIVFSGGRFADYARGLFAAPQPSFTARVA